MEIGKKHGIIIKPCGESKALEALGADCSGCMTVQTFETAIGQNLDVPPNPGNRKEYMYCRKQDAMMTLRNCQIVGHVHDELIIECSPEVSLNSICEQMGRTPPWLPGNELQADGYECSFYMKQ